MATALLIASSVPAQTADSLPPPLVLADATPVAAYHSHLVFSRADGHGRFELVQRVGSGPVERVPVASRAVPFDVDVGPTDGGRVLAVYSRCKVEPTLVGGGVPGPPEYQKGRGCDIYKVGLARGKEKRFTAVNSREGTEFWPTYWKGRLGFARRYDKRPDYPYLYVKTVASSRPSQRMPGGQRKECDRGPDGRTRCSDDSKSVPRELELYGKRLAFAWRFQGLGEGEDYDLRIDTIGGGHRLMDHSSSGGLTAIVLGGPSFEGGRLFWSRACFFDASGCPGRSRLVKSTYTGSGFELEADAPRRMLAHERDALATTLLVDSSGAGDCEGDPPTAGGTCTLTVTRPDFHPRD